MAASFRLGSMMLSRVAATPAYLRASPSTTRAFSTSLAFRFRATAPTLNNDDYSSSSSSSSPPPTHRLNPLVGNIRPKPQPPPPVTTEAAPRFTQPPKPQQAPSSSAEVPPNSDLPPPPPPPTAESEVNSPFGTPNKAPTHPYTSATDYRLDIAAIVANNSMKYSQQNSNIVDPQSRPNIRAKPVTGRTVFIRDRITPTSAPTPLIAINVLNRITRDQKVKAKVASQRFHERKGLKKKRLRSQRWKARFKAGFKATVSRVMELKRQGW